MALINKPYDFHPHGPNAVIKSDEVDANFDVLYDAVNGKLDDANIAEDAKISARKLDLRAVLIDHWMSL